MPPIGSILRHNHMEGDEEDFDRTFMDVQALIREENYNQRLHIRQSHINMLDESIRIQ